MIQSKWQAYSHLMRIDKPIGTLLLLWPTLWALWLAGKGVPSLSVLVVFVVGVFMMRAAGCVVNDYADRAVDGHVKRTAGRPMPSGRVSEKEAKILFVVLVLISFGLVLTLNAMTIWLSLAALALAWAYPFMKRVTHLPQFVLGAAFGWGIPMAYAAVSESLPLSCWLLLLANICWTVAYDTLYAMVDRDDDLKIGVKSTAILFGRYDKLIVGLLQFATLLLMLWVGYLTQMSGAFYWSLLLAGALFIHQQKQIATRERDACFKAFPGQQLRWAGAVSRHRVELLAGLTTYSNKKGTRGCLFRFSISELVFFHFHCGRLRQGVGFRRHADAFNGQLDFRGNQIAQHVVHLHGVLTDRIADVVDVAFFTQRRHQGGEHRLVEELRRIDTVQYRQALGHDTALFLQRTAVDARISAEDRHGDGIALQRFTDTGGQQL